ncbi:CHASE2 and HATPase_c domain-containing protein [Paraburkholderia hayleyella]|uniref:CHASE2 and HATPase_c domain-containing protein n=1 Tax=Paraburkholderia hayleyella TaxID=2152889 RepID=UPI001FE5B89E|nr:CHASE2 and HATPase_c domain-containing protein [Paraburkholderia hayleyella]
MRRWLKRCASLGLGRGVFLVGMLLLAALSSHPGGTMATGSLDRAMFDAMRLWLPTAQATGVAVIEIDEKTLHILYPTDPLHYGERLLEKLHDARSIVIDLPLSPTIATPGFTQAVRQNGRVVLALPSIESDGTGQPALSPPAALRDAAAGYGHRTVTRGHYGVVNGFVPSQQIGHAKYSHIALEALRVAGQPLPFKLDDYEQPHALSLGATRTDTVLLMLPRASSLSSYSFIDVIEGRVPPAAFAGKIVFVGYTAWQGEGRFRVSSLHMEAVSRAGLDALIASALMTGSVVREWPSAVTVPVYLVLALGMILICRFVSGRLMHVMAFGWGLLVLMLPVVLCTQHIWLPIGFLPAACLMIYAFFAWERLGRTFALMRREVQHLREISASMGGMGSLDGSASTVSALASSATLHELKTAMSEIRVWQKMYVDLINQLPYPVFMAMGGKVVIWNARAVEFLDSSAATDVSGGKGITLASITELVDESRAAGRPAVREIELNGAAHVLLCQPLLPTDGTAVDAAEPGEALHLVCLINTGEKHDTVSHDKQMLRHIAHDLRSPLTTILALIERRGAETAAGGVRNDHVFLQDLREQVDYSLRVAKDFMQLSRAERMDRKVFAPVALVDLAVEAMDQVWHSASEKSIELLGPHNETGCEPYVQGNLDMLLRSVVNVLDNAIKYSSEHTTIEVRIVATADARFVVHVIDQGIGMTAETIERLFEPFFQAVRQRDAGAGVGLGLPFVRAVVERHGGTVDVSSELGQGTDFRISLPASVEPQAP